MSNTKKTTTRKAAPAATKYTVDVLRRNVEELTGYKEEVAAGALFNCTKKEMTLDEFKKLIKDFLNKEVK